MPDSLADLRGLQTYSDNPGTRKALLRGRMEEGDSLVQDSSGQWQILRNARRDTNRSVLNSLGQFADSMGFGDDRRRSRLVAGIASQWYGLDDAGNPTFGETPGIVHETKALGVLPTTLLRFAMDKAVGNVVDTSDPMYQMAQQALLSDPEWAAEAAEKADRIHQAVREDMNLKAPRGFAENAQESAGVMLGQLPVPGRGAVKSVEELSKLARAKQGVGTASEWFTPTVRPTVGNYSTGALTGGALGWLADEPEEEGVPTILPNPDQPGLYDVRPVYSDGSVGYSGHPDDQEALKRLEEEERLAQNYADGGSVKDYDSGGLATVRAMRAKYAAGGEVADPAQAIRAAIAHIDNGDTGSALQVLRASPEALRDPGVASAMQKLQPQAFAKGGKVSGAKDILEKVAKVADDPYTPGHPAFPDTVRRGKSRGLFTASEAADLLKQHKEALKEKFAKGGKVSGIEAALKRAATTLAEAKKIVRSHGHTLVKDNGEYIVKKRGERTRIEGDDSHYFTDDIDDAVGTSADMARRRKD